MEKHLDGNRSVKLDISNIIYAVFWPVGTAYYSQTMPAKCLSSITSTSDLEQRHSQMNKCSFSKFGGKTYQFEQFQFVRIDASTTEYAYTTDAYIWSVYRKANGIRGTITRVP